MSISGEPPESAELTEAPMPNLGNPVPGFSLSSSGVTLDHADAGESTGALAAP